MTKRMTTDQLEAIRMRAEKATEGNWNYTAVGGGGRNSTVASFGKELTMIGEIKSISDAEFIAHSREDIPALLAEIERLSGIISWNMSCAECSNQLAEDWRIFRGSIICAECAEELGGDTE